MVSIDDLDRAVNRQLTLYGQRVTEGTKKAAKLAVKQMVDDTKAQAYKYDTGAYRNHIASKKLEETANGLTMAWYVKYPYHGLSHLLEHGHALRNGGRSVSYNFINPANEKAQELFLTKVEEAIQNDG